MRKQKTAVTFYKLVCESPLCGLNFYEFEPLKRCPHCGIEIGEDNLGEEIEAIFEIDVKSSKLKHTGYAKPKRQPSDAQKAASPPFDSVAP